MEEILLLLIGIVAGSVMAVTGAMWGVIEAAAAWFQAVWEDQTSSPLASPSDSREPAEPSYFFSGAWHDWREVGRSAWSLAVVGSRRHFENPSDSFVAIFHRSAGAGVLCAAPFWIALFSGLHGTGLMACVVALLPILGLFRLAGSGRQVFYRLSSRCPRCHYRSSLPAFRCDQDGCGRLHRRLLPGRHGLFSHRCLCGNCLPANFWNGRERLEAVCPLCGYPRRGNATTPLCVALAGGTSNGKTHFLARALLDLLHHEAPALGWEISPSTPNDEAVLEALQRPYREGAVAHTPAIVPSALSLTLTIRGIAVPWEVMLYDPGGESFQIGGGLEQHVYYQFLNGVIFVIDPFSAPNVAERHQSALDQPVSAVRPGQMDLDETFNMTMAALMRSGRFDGQRHFSIPLALVVSKLDALGLVSEFAGMDGRTVDEKCRNLLAEAGLQDLVGKIAGSFRKCRSFPSGELTASGFRNACFSDGKVLSWILQEADSRLKSATVKRLGTSVSEA